MPKEFGVANGGGQRELLDTFRIRTGQKTPVDPRKPDGPQAERVESFRLFRPADSAVLMSVNLASRMRENASEEVKQQAVAATIDFLGACMDPEEHRTFYEILVDPRFGMDFDELASLSQWAVETIGKRPTRRSTGSPRGRSAAGKNSTAGARSKASNR